MKFKTYLFDFDGTLVDSMPTFASVMLRILKENDIALVPEKLVQLANAGGGGDNITVVTLTK